MMKVIQRIRDKILRIPASSKLWMIGALMLFFIFNEVQKYDARVRPGQPSPDDMIAVLKSIHVLAESKIANGLVVKSRSGRIIYSEKFEAKEAMNDVNLYYGNKLSEEGWILVYSKYEQISSYMKFCKGRYGIILEVLGLDKFSSYSLSVVWSYNPDDFAYCGSSGP